MSGPSCPLMFLFSCFAPATFLFVSSFTLYPFVYLFAIFFLFFFSFTLLFYTALVSFQFCFSFFLPFLFPCFLSFFSFFFIYISSPFLSQPIPFSLSCPSLHFFPLFFFLHSPQASSTFVRFPSLPPNYAIFIMIHCRSCCVDGKMALITFGAVIVLTLIASGDFTFLYDRDIQTDTEKLHAYTVLPMSRLSPSQFLSFRSFLSLFLHFSPVPLRPFPLPLYVPFHFFLSSYVTPVFPFPKYTHPISSHLPSLLSQPPHPSPCLANFPLLALLRPSYHSLSSSLPASLPLPPSHLPFTNSLSPTSPSFSSLPLSPLSLHSQQVFRVRK